MCHVTAIFIPPLIVMCHGHKYDNYDVVQSESDTSSAESTTAGLLLLSGAGF